MSSRKNGSTATRPAEPASDPRPAPRFSVGREVLAALLVAALSVVLAVLALRVSPSDLTQRWLTGGDDQILHYMLFSSSLDAFPFAVNDQLGFPDGMNAFFSVQFDVATALLVSVLGLVFTNGILLLNVFYLVTFALVGVTSYTFFRALRVRRWIAVFFALVLNLAPYHFTRVRDGHAFLANFWAIPLIGILVLIVAGDKTDPFSRWVERGVSSRRRLVRALVPSAVLGLLVASTGAYYFVFAGIVVGGAWVFSTIARLVQRSPRASHLRPTAALGFLALFVVVELAILAQNFGERYAPYFEARAIGLSEHYGGKFMSLILAWPGSQIPLFSQFSARYARESGVLPSTEAPGAPLIASIGIVLIVALIIVNTVASSGALERTAVGRFVTDARVRALAAATLWTLLFYITTGLGMLVALVIGPQIRAWSRFSIVLIMLSLGVVAVAVDMVTAKYRARQIVVAILAVVVVFDQLTGVTTVFQLKPTEDEEMKSFVADSDALLPDGCGVVQLPLKSFPDSQSIGALNDYDEALPYLYTEGDDLRWSYGAVGGTYGWDVWKDATTPASFADTVEETDACAIEIDLNGYTENVDGWKPFVEEVTGTDVPDVESSSGRYILFSVDR